MAALSLTAIIIDDEPYIREVVRVLGHWNELGIEVIGEAADGAAALELINQLKPDIVVSDVKMPRLDGLELAAELQKQLQPPQVILISGYDDFELVRRALKCGVSDYLLKPIKEDELNEQLAACASACMTQTRTEPQERSLSGGKWLEHFDAACRQLSDLMHGGNSENVSSGFDNMLTSLREDGAGLAESVYCYYTLISQLGAFATENGYKLEELCLPGHLEYVFDSGDNITEVIEHVRGLAISCLYEVQRRAKQRGRLDTDLVRHYIDENYDQNLTLQSTADFFHVSREYLSRSFKADFGVSFSDYLLARRMERARELIVDYHVPIKDTWQILHFVDQTHFYKCFKRYFGKAPGEMRAGSSIDNKTGH